MHPRAAELIAVLPLQPHPEGGFYRQIFRSPVQVTPMDGRGTRAALTTIYFVLPEGSFSRWHQVASDEVWHLYEGGPLELLELSRLELLSPSYSRLCGRSINPRLQNKTSSKNAYRSVPLIERDRALKLRSTPARVATPRSSQSAARAGHPPKCSTQRAGIAPPHAAGD